MGYLPADRVYQALLSLPMAENDTGNMLGQPKLFKSYHKDLPLLISTDNFITS